MAALLVLLAGCGEGALPLAPLPDGSEEGSPGIREDPFTPPPVEEAGRDNRPPILSAGPDVEGWANAPLTLEGSASDAEGDALTLSWRYLPGPDTPAGASCTFGSPELPVTTLRCTHEGSYTVQLTASDGVNLSVSANATVRVRNASRVTLCRLPRFTRERILGLCGYNTAGPDDSAIVAVWFTVNGGEPLPVVPEPSGGFVEATSPVLDEGVHRVRLHARSAAGHVTLDEQTVTVDRTPPLLIVTAPTTHRALAGTEVDVTSYVSDLSTVRVQTQWYRSSYVPGGVGWVTHRIDLVNRGYSQLLVRALDKAGNVAEVRLRLFVPHLPPAGDAPSLAGSGPD